MVAVVLSMPGKLAEAMALNHHGKSAFPESGVEGQRPREAKDRFGLIATLLPSSKTGR